MKALGYFLACSLFGFWFLASGSPQVLCCLPSKESRPRDSTSSTLSCTSQRLQNPIVKEYTSNYRRIPSTWRGRGLSKSFISRVIIGVTPFRVLITLLIYPTY